MQTSLLQSEHWAELKKKYGWTSKHLMGFSVLSRALRFGYSFAYIPEITGTPGELAITAARAQSALSHAKTSKTIFGRAEFLIPYSEAGHHKLTQAGFVKARDEIQPEHRQVIELKGSIAQIYAQMKPKGRYNVRVAEKNNVTVANDNSKKAIKTFIGLSKATSARKGFVGREPAYLQDLVAILDREGVGGLWVATHEGKILAGAIVSFVGKRASYLYGASADHNRSVMAPYLLHARIIEEAKRLGCDEYDLIGVAPLDAAHNHSWAGISRFKREFGGETVRYLGSYDRVYKPVLYKAYSLARKSP